jgi:hypothetical protein
LPVVGVVCAKLVMTVALVWDEWFHSPVIDCPHYVRAGPDRKSARGIHTAGRRRVARP